MSKKKERIQQKITPEGLFDEKSFLGRGVAEDFAKARLIVTQGKVEFDPIREAKQFGRNAGAIEVITGTNRESSYGFSQPAIFENSRAHTERILMRDVLEELIPGNFPEGGLRRPSQMANIPPNEQIPTNQRERLILNAVTRHAPIFKDYLDRTGSVVKMFSERIPCGKGSKDGCNTFLDNILPETDGTAVGYFTEKIGQMGTKEVETSANQVVEIYQNYINRSNENNSSSWDISNVSPDSRLVVLGVGGGQYPLNTYLEKRISHHNTSTSMDS